MAEERALFASACSAPWLQQHAAWLAVLAAVLLALSGCGGQKPPANTAVMLIESSPTNLDPRVGLDAQSEHIDQLLFDALVQHNNHFGFAPDLAVSWQTPNPVTYVFHLRKDVHFSDGQPLTSHDVK